MATKKKVEIGIPENDINRKVYEFELKERDISILGTFGDDKATSTEVLAELEKLAEENKSAGNQLFYETGCVLFDLAISNGKGLPIGSSILFYAEPGTGKTTLFADVLYRILKKHKEYGIPYKVLYLDIEGSRSLLMSMGLGEFIEDGSLLYVNKPINFDELDKYYDAVVKGKGKLKGVNLVLIDSINSVTSLQTQKDSCNKAEFGNDARARTKFYSKYMAACNAVGITNLFVSQVRTKQGAGMFEEATKPAVSNADLHYVDVIAKLGALSGKFKETEKVDLQSTTGGVIQFAKRFCLTVETGKIPSNQLLKNRYGRIPKVTGLVEYGKRICNAFSTREMLITWGIATKDGNNFILSDEFLDYIGRPELKGVSLPKVAKVKDKDKPSLPRICKEHHTQIIEYLRTKDMYKACIEQDPEDDYDI